MQRSLPAPLAASVVPAGLRVVTGDLTTGLVTEVMEGSPLQTPPSAHTLVSLLTPGQECVFH